ncbi:MAG: Gfo/Idh/MocA family oxidoreductase [Candidatus Brocadiia bacterium]
MINAAVVGYGYAGRVFHCYLIKQAPGLRLHAVSTRDPDRRERAAEEQEVAAYPGLDELLTDEQVDLVVLATPHYTHRDLAVRSMDAGRHVVTDKIMCMNADEARDMIGAAERNDVLLSVFHNRRWDWDYLTVRKAVADGLLGEPFLFQTAIMGYGTPRGWRSEKDKSGGILYDWPPHLVDQALQLVPAPVRRVFCRIQHRRPEIDIGSYGHIVLEFEGGVLYEVEISNLGAAPKPRWFVLGTDGGLVKHGLDPQESALRDGDIDAAEEPADEHARLFTPVDRRREECVLEPVRGSWKSYYRNIAEALEGEAELAVKPAEMLELMRVFDAASESAETGRVVELD